MKGESVKIPKITKSTASRNASVSSDFRGAGVTGESGDLNILERMLDGLGVENAHDAAFRLLERFGGFGGVFAATEAELEDMGLSSRAASFFGFVNPALRRMAVVDCGSSGIVDERTAVRHALTLLGRRNGAGAYAVYLDGAGRRICSEYFDADSALSAAAVGACRFKTKKLLLVSIKADGEVSGIDKARAYALSDLAELLDILGIELVDYIETDGVEFFSLRRAIKSGDGLESVFEASGTPYEKADFRGGTERLLAAERNEKTGRR